MGNHISWELPSKRECRELQRDAAFGRAQLLELTALLQPVAEKVEGAPLLAAALLLTLLVCLSTPVECPTDTFRRYARK